MTDCAEHHGLHNKIANAYFLAYTMSPVTRLNLFTFLRTGFEILKVYAGLPLLRVISEAYDIHECLDSV